MKAGQIAACFLCLGLRRHLHKTIWISRLLRPAEPISMAQPCCTPIQSEWPSNCVIGHFKLLSKLVKSNSAGRTGTFTLSDSWMPEEHERHVPPLNRTLHVKSKLVDADYVNTSIKHRRTTHSITVRHFSPSKMNYNDCQMTGMWVCYGIIPQDSHFFFSYFFLSQCPFRISAKEISGRESVRANNDTRMTVHLVGLNCWRDFGRSATKLG